jgi:hypothetical protein
MPGILRSAALLALPALLAMPAIGCVDISAGEARYIDTVEKRFTVTGVPTLSIGTFDGSVEVSTWDRPEVLVVVEKHAFDKQAADRMIVTAEQSGDVINVDVRDRRERGGFNVDFGSHSARLTITVPTRAQIEAKTGDGRVAVRDVEGNVSVHTGDGSIRLEHVSGAVDASSGDGSIDVEGTIARLRARSGDGRVRVHATGGSPTADWSVSTGDGSVVLEVPDQFDADLDATTGDGRVDVRDVQFDGGSEDHRRRHVARGRIGKGGAKITIRTGDGSITVRSADAAPRS